MTGNVEGGYLERRLERALRQQAALLSLSSVDDEAFDQRMERILRVDADTLEIARVSFWSFREDVKGIHCDRLLIRGESRFESGLVLLAKDFPRYFEALGGGTTIVAHNAHTHSSTSEFSENYLKPNGIGAMLDAPVYVRGHLEGVVCHEHVGDPREWSDDEQLFAMSVAQQVALAIEARRREAAEEQVRESERRFRSIVEGSPTPMLVASHPEGIILYANRAMAELFGVPYDSVIGQSAEAYYASADDRAHLLGVVQKEGRLTSREVMFKRANGQQFWALLSVEPFRYDGRHAVVVGISDLTKQKQLESFLRHVALHDALTGLPNRPLFLDLLRNEVARAQRDDKYRFAVLYIDCDGFKLVNDAFGHEVGDNLLVRVATQLRTSLRATDTAARIGGDEFTVLLVGIKDNSEVDQVVERIRDRLLLTTTRGTKEIKTSASIGVFVSDGIIKDVEEIIRCADRAMYEAKRSQRPPLETLT